MALTAAQQRQAEKNRKYWKNREDEALKHYITDEKEYDKRINQIYANMLDACQKEINSFYGRYAAKEDITLAEAKKRVSKADIEAYERKAAKYVKDKDFSKKANEEMLLYNTMMKVNRLEMLKANIGLETIAGFDELEKFMGEILKGRTIEELERQAGILGKTIQGNATKAHAIVNASFHHATFSDRIWMYQDLMKADLSKLLQSGLIQGKNPRLLARDLKKTFQTSTFNAERLMRTELARVQTDAQKRSFEYNNFEKYMFIVNSGCCEICQEMAKKDVGHGKGIYLVKDMQAGYNAAPLHPHCRCSTAAYEDSDDYEAWLNFLEQGGTTEEWERRKATNKAPITKDELRQQIKDSEKRIKDIDSEIQGIDRNIEKHKIRDYDDLQGLTKKGISDRILKIEKRLAEIDPISERYYNRPERGTDEYSKWREWRRSIDFIAIQDEQLKITQEHANLTSKLGKWDKYEEWQRWKKANPLDKLELRKADLAKEIQDLEKQISEHKKQLSKLAIPSHWKRIEGTHTRESDLAATNPNYKQGKEWRVNCQRCVSAYEARRRGYEVEAKPAILDGSDRMPYMFDKKGGWTSVYNGIKPIPCTSNRTAGVKTKVESTMSSFGDGARAIVRVQWQKKYGGGGHVFIAEQVDGKTIFIDPQSNNQDVSNYFSLAKTKETYVLRIDDLDFTDNIEKCCESVK